MRGKSLKFAGGAVIGMAAACLFSGMDAAVAQAAYGVTYNEGGNHLEDLWGTGYNEVLGWLGQHTNDNYYLGTIHSVAAPNDGDNRNPVGNCQGVNGQTDIPGSAVMNCTGFVWHVMYKASGMDHDTAYATIPSLGGMGAGAWGSYLQNNQVEYRTYYGDNNTAAEFDQFVMDIVNDGYIEPGDVIWLWDNSAGMTGTGIAAGSSPNHHIGIYIGTYFDGQPHAYPWVDEASPNRWWHSFGSNAYTGESWMCNLTSKVSPGAFCDAITVIKLGKGGQWLQDASGWWWMRSDGSYPAGTWEMIKGKWYLFDERGYMRTGWVNQSGTWYYLQPNGAMQTGWGWINGQWYYFSQSGAMQIGWEWIDGAWYYLDQDGKMQTYWVQINDSWYYLNGNGSMQVGWIWDNGYWYYLSEDGKMKTDWMFDGIDWYYLGKDGKMKTYWIRVENEWYYFSGSGKMQTAWLWDAGNWYYLSESGRMEIYWTMIDGDWYYFDENGVMQNYWVCINGNWYFLSSGGVMQTGWLYDCDNWYYMDESGKMQTDVWVDGYYLDEHGIMH